MQLPAATTGFRVLRIGGTGTRRLIRPAGITPGFAECVFQIGERLLIFLDILLFGIDLALRLIHILSAVLLLQAAVRILRKLFLF